MKDLGKRARAGGRRIVAALAAVGAMVLLAACGGGGGSGGEGGYPTEPPAQPALPAATTQTLGTAGGQVSAPLSAPSSSGAGASVVLVLPADALGADTAITITPQEAASGEWTRFSITPDMSTFSKPFTLRLKPPASVAATQLPALSAQTADGPVLLPLRVESDGTLEVTLNPALVNGTSVGSTSAAAGSTGTGAAGRSQRLGLARALAGAAVVPNFSGTLLINTCGRSQAVLDDIRAVINGAPSVRAVSVALNTLALLRDRCDPVSARAQLAQFTSEMPLLYSSWLNSWRAEDHGQIDNATLRRFAVGLRRLIAICQMAHFLGSPLTCLQSAEVEDQYTEFADGLFAEAVQRDSVATLWEPLRVLMDMTAEAQMFGAEGAVPPLVATTTVVADRLIGRAYALCNHGELFEFMKAVRLGLPASVSETQLLKSIGACGLSITVSGLSAPAADGTFEVVSTAQLQPGGVAGNGRSSAIVDLDVPFDGTVLLTVQGMGYHCSRVVGSPDANDQLLVVLANSFTQAIGRRFGGDFLFFQEDNRYRVPDLLAGLGRAAGSTESFLLHLQRQAAQIADCSDSNGQRMSVVLPALQPYVVRLNHLAPRRPVGGTVVVTVNEDSVQEIGTATSLDTTHLQVNTSTRFGLDMAVLLGQSQPLAFGSHQAVTSGQVLRNQQAEARTAIRDMNQRLCEATITNSARHERVFNGLLLSSPLNLVLTVNADGSFVLEPNAQAGADTALFNSEVAAQGFTVKNFSTTEAGCLMPSGTLNNTSAPVGIRPLAAHFPVLRGTVQEGRLQATGSMTVPAPSSFGGAGATVQMLGDRTVTVTIDLVLR